jgi:hypothetical protein
MDRRTFFQRTAGALAAVVIAPMAPIAAKATTTNLFCNGVWMKNDSGAIVQGEVTETAMEDDLIPPDVAAHFRRFGTFDKQTHSWRIGAHSNIQFMR